MSCMSLEEYPILWDVLQVSLPGVESSSVLRVTGPSKCEARAKCLLPPAGVCRWSLNVVEMQDAIAAAAEVSVMRRSRSTSWLDVGIILDGGSPGWENERVGRYQNAECGTELMARCCGSVCAGGTFLCELDMCGDLGKFSIKLLEGGREAADTLVFTDSPRRRSVQDDCGGQIWGQFWRPFVQLRAAKEGSSVAVQLTDLQFELPGNCASDLAAMMSCAILTNDLTMLKGLVKAARGGLGREISDIQCAVEPEGICGALFIGCASAVHPDNLRALDVRAVLRLGASFVHLDLHRPDDVSMAVLTIPIDDNKLSDMRPHFLELVSFQQRHLSMGENVLVHCGAGVSRSATAVIAFLMWRHSGWSFEQSLRYLKERRPWVHPNAAFASQLQNFNFAELAVEF